jgi:NAD(P)-dependent dehydrogenase (short-subunit alcohol dehydrogenase family)
MAMPAPSPLAGRRVLVTGASSGIGATASTMLALRGARVVGTGRTFSGLGLALEATVIRDLTEPGAPQDVVDVAAAALGGLDVVVSNAGAGWLGPYESMRPAEIDAMVDLNLRAPMHLARAAAPHLLASGGQLVLVGSIAGLVGVADEVAYGTAKAGLRGLADGLRAEWAGRVTVTLVSPGPVDTAFFSRRNRPYGRAWPKPVPVAPVARSIVRAVEGRRSDVVLPAWLGVAARLNGGFPELYRALARVAEGVGGQR